jgi:hypothetical protein
MFYNARLDHWTNTWGATSGSMLQAALIFSEDSSLGPYANGAHLYANHVRLCVNSISFGIGGDAQTPDNAAPWLQRGLDSALSVIKIQADDAEAESRLNFAPDVRSQHIS